MGGGRGGERGSAVGAAVGWAARGIPTLCNEMGASGRKDPPSNPTPPPRARHRPPPCPSLPGTVTARPLFAKGVLFCPSRCQQSSQGMGGGHRKGCGTRPPDPPKGTPLGCQHQQYTAVWPPDPKRSGGLWLPSQPHVCPHPSPGGVRGVPTQCEVPGGGQHRTRHRDCAQRGQRAVWVALHHGHHHGTEGGMRWHGGRGGKPWGLWWHGDHNGTP